MVKNYLSPSCINAFSNLQLQSRLPGALQHHSCFAARSRAIAFCHSRLQTRTAGASHQIDQRSRSADNGDDNRARATVSYTFRRPHLPKVPRDRQVFLLSLQSCALFVDNFFRYRDPTSATRGSTLPKKNRVSCPRVVSPVNSHASKLLRFPTT